MGCAAGEYVVAEKIVTEEEEEEKVLLIGPLSSGSLHSMGTHDSSSSLDWALDAAGSKVGTRLETAPEYPCLQRACLHLQSMHDHKHRLSSQQMSASF
jgi:hypothetical protein